MLSRDTRERMVRAYERGRNAEETARNFGVDVSTVYRLKRLKDETGTVEARTAACGRKPSLDTDAINRIDSYIQEQPDITIREINEKLGNPVSDETVRKAVVALGWRYKKKSVNASERRRVRCCAEAKRVGRASSEERCK